MTILITGGAGYIGCHMAWHCHDQKIPFVVLDDLSNGYPENLPPSAPFVRGDIADEQGLSTLFTRYGVTAVIHFAAKIVVGESVLHPLDYYRINTGKTAILVDRAIKHGIKKFVFSSTAAVYGDAEQILLREDAPKNPTSPYGRSKWMVEHILSDAHQAHGLDYVCLRYFNVAGADPAGRAGQSGRQATHLVKLACQAALGLRDSLSIFGDDYSTADGTCIRDYLHVSDLVDAHAGALRYLQHGGKPLVANCGYGHGTSVREVIEMVKKVSGIDFTVHVAPRRAGDPPSLVADPALARQIFDWVPRYDDLETIVRHALDWEKKCTVSSI